MDSASQFIQSSQLWAQIPWGEIMIFAAGLTLGEVIFYALCPQSELRAWLRNRFKTFEVIKVFAAHEAKDGKTWFDVKVRLKFLKSIQNVDILLDIDPDHGIRKTLTLQKGGSYVEDEELKIKVAKVPSNYHEAGVFGDGTNTYPLINNSKNLVTLDVQYKGFLGFKRRQKFKLFIEMLSDNSGTCGRFYLTDETKDIYEEINP